MQNLVHHATELVGEVQLGCPGLSAATVAAAIRSASGQIYTGVCVDLRCGIGFCAEHAAVAEMLKHRETQVESIVAVRADGVLPPCGRCRELLVQVDPSNLDARVGMPEGRVVRLRELLPDAGVNVS